MATQGTASLIDLSDTELTVADPAIDVRGRTVVDRDDQEVGKVKSILIDDREHKARFLEVESGGFLGVGGETRLIPVDAVTDVDENRVRIDHTREHVHGSPAYDPDLKLDVWDDPYYRDVYGYYGFAPYWSAGYVYPAYPYHR